MSTAISFPSLLQQFFTDRLIKQRQASPHTIASYRDTFRLLLRFAQSRLGRSPDRFELDQIDAPLIGAFLDDLEKSRHIAARTRNLRLLGIEVDDALEMAEQTEVRGSLTGYEQSL
jgi:site-specific recombinase XerD